LSSTIITVFDMADRPSEIDAVPGDPSPPPRRRWLRDLRLRHQR
jgi:hypothetical protein